MFHFYNNKKYDRFRSPRDQRSGFSKIIISFFGTLCFFLVLFVFQRAYLSPPEVFPVQNILKIEKGNTLMEVSKKLETERYIHNANIFQWVVMFLEGERNVIAGSYFFSKKLTTIEMAQRLTTGNFGLYGKQVTFPEGFTVEQMAHRLKKVFPTFQKEKFLTLAKPKEGFLFPDTYEFFPNVEPEKVIQTMSDNFKRKIMPLKPEIKQNPEKTLREIIIMASILEEEAKTTQSRKVISGILWDRIKIGMLLQVDATFEYFLGKNTYELTLSDLKADSPYNTYRYKGLPPGPITNPGLDAIKAAMHPIETGYVYYLSDRAGNIYYSKTLARHRELKEMYVN